MLLQSDASGNVAFPDLPRGSYDVQSTDAKGVTETKIVNVLGSKVAAPELAFTGMTGRFLGLSLCLILGGLVLVSAMRGKRQLAR